MKATPAGSLLSCYPQLFTAQAREGAAVARCPVSWQEAVAFQVEMARQLADVPDGGAVRFAVEP